MFLLRQIGVLFALLAGVATSQLPEFAQQYRQRLGGAIDELQRIVSDFDLDAKSNAMTWAQGIDKLTGSQDPLVSQRGRRMRETEARLARLKQQNEAFKEAGTFRRIAVMTRSFDSYIASRAYEDFEPAAPVSSEGFVTALVGFLAGLGLWKLFGWPVRRWRRRRQQKLPVAGGRGGN